MTDGTYNGWATYETWLVNLWLTNDQGTQEYCLEFLKGRREGRLDQSIMGDDAFNLREFVEDILLEDRPENGLMADLINAAIGAVRWMEAATAMLEIEQ